MKEMSNVYTPVISLIGRPNVGKSSIFNRLMKISNKAITHDTPGVTRDRHYGIASFDNARGECPVEAVMVDTGGFYPQKIEERSDKKEDFFFNIMADHAKLAIDESDLVLFVVDVREGVVPFDQTIANFIRSSKKEFWILVNKYDSDAQMGEEADFYSLGVDYQDMLVISAAHAIGFDGLTEKLNQKITELITVNADRDNCLQKGVKAREEVVANLAIIGAPNAGKSTLLNKLLGAERALVSNIPGTTVDPIEGYFDIFFGRAVDQFNRKYVSKDDIDRESKNQAIAAEYEAFQEDIYEKVMNGNLIGDIDEIINLDLSRNKNFDDDLEKKIFEDDLTVDGDDLEEIEEFGEFEETVDVQRERTSPYRSVKLVDTAGIRRQKSISDQIESQSVFRALRAITDSDIVVILIDATKGISHQDRRLCDIALEKGKSLIVCLNKVDLLREKINDHKARKEWIQDLRDTIPWLQFCEIITISAKYGKRIKSLKTAIKDTILVRNRMLTTSALNRCLSGLVARNQVFLRGTRQAFKIKYASMVKSNPPTFLLFTNKSKEIPKNYRRYLQNGLRESFDFVNTPVHLIFRSNGELDKR